MSAAFCFDGAAYLRRIACRDEPRASLDFLRALQAAQLSTIPFENFDLCLGRGVDLEPAKIFDKLVGRRRGGYCFEVNGLFLMVLEAFGFEARALLARVHVTGRATGRSHQVSLVELDGRRFVVDVGFGSETPPEPVPLELDAPFRSRDMSLRLLEDEAFGFLLQSDRDGAWSTLYSFDLEHVCAGDIEYANHFTSTSPTSHFTTTRVAALPTRGGLFTLSNHTLKKRVGQAVEERELEGGPPYMEALRDVFGIELDASYADLRPLG